MDKRKVCWITNTPAPYKVELLNLLGEDVDLLVLFEAKSRAHRNKNWYNYEFKSFKGEFLQEGKEKKRIQEAANSCDLVICSDYTNRFNMYAVRCFHKLRKKAVLYADGGYAVKHGVLDLGVRMLMDQYDAYMDSGVVTDEKYFRYYGVTENIHHFRFSCMSEKELEVCRNLALKKEQCRLEAGYREKVILLSVGQQVPRKGYDVLVRAMCKVGPEVGLYIVGGEPEENVQALVQQNHLNNVHFIPFCSKEELRKYYAGADVFVLPTRYDIWGLVINEAMAYGLPVITTDKCVAGLQLIRDCDNGILVPSEDSEALAEAILALSMDEKRRKELGRKSLEGIAGYSLENMKEDILKNIEEIVSK